LVALSNGVSERFRGLKENEGPPKGLRFRYHSQLLLDEHVGKSAEHEDAGTAHNRMTGMALSAGCRILEKGTPAGLLFRFAEQTATGKLREWREIIIIMSIRMTLRLIFDRSEASSRSRHVGCAQKAEVKSEYWQPRVGLFVGGWYRLTRDSSYQMGGSNHALRPHRI